MITLTCIVPFLQTLTSAPAVPTTVTVPLLRVQIQRDPLVVHVTVLTSEMAEVAIYQVIICPILRDDLHSLNPYLHSLEAHYSGGGGGLQVKFCQVCAAGLSEPLPLYSLFCDQLQIAEPILVTFRQICNFRDPMTHSLPIFMNWPIFFKLNEEHLPTVQTFQYLS